MPQCTHSQEAELCEFLIPLMGLKWDSPPPPPRPNYQSAFSIGPGVVCMTRMQSLCVTPMCSPHDLDVLTACLSLSSGDAGILCVSVTGGVQWLLRAGCHGLLLSAHRDQRSRPAGVQPPGMGPGDGGPRGSRPRCRQVELWLSRVVTGGCGGC